MPPAKMVNNKNKSGPKPHRGMKAKGGGNKTAGNKADSPTPKLPESVPGQPF